LAPQFHANLLFGLLQGRGDQKFVPEIGSKDLENIASVSSEATTLYDKIRSRIFSNPPYSLGFPSDTTQSQYYPQGGSRLTKDEINAVSRTMELDGLWPENTRLRKADPEEGVELFYVLQASVENDSEMRQIKADAGPSIRVMRGDHSPALSKICTHLKEALKYAANEKQKVVLEKYIESFTTGDLEAYRESQRIWIQDKNPRVENILGFVEPYRDPAGIRAEFEGLVAIESPQESRVLKQFVENSDHFIRQLPWTRGAVENNGKGPFEKALFEPPSFASIHSKLRKRWFTIVELTLRLALAYCSSILFDGINLPNVRHLNNYSSMDHSP
jgi:dipeptidyl-peptidase III